MTVAVPTGEVRRLGVAAAFDGSRLVPGDVVVHGACIEAIGVEPGVGDRIAAPGFVDLQVNGFGGVDLQVASVEEIVACARRLCARGVTAFQPTLISAPVSQMSAALERLDEARRLPDVPHVLPAQLEGPFLAPARRGAHRAEHLRAPDHLVAAELLDAGAVGFVTIAPELPGALPLIEELAGNGVVVAIGHTDATAEEAAASFDAGARALTHTGNAHRPWAPRDPGPLGAALHDERVRLTAICDGVHLHALTVELLRRASGDRLIAVSDAMTAAGLADGSYCFGDLVVRVDGGRAVLRNGRLAGSTAALDQELRFLVETGASLEEALGAVTSRPAALLGAAGLGSLAPGGQCDVAILDAELRVVETLIAGARVYELGERERIG